MNDGRGVDDGGAQWKKLSEQVGGHLIRVAPPLRGTIDEAGSAVLRNLRNPFVNEDEPGAFQTTGWLDAFVAEASPRAVAATTAADIAAAVTFARDRGVRVVIKGTGHDYLGRSSAPDSLLIWTHHMREVTVHDAFEIAGGVGVGVPAITVGAGTRWLEAYEVATKHGRYVQGGGCTSVGAAGGFIQGSGFGSFSKMFGTAAGSVLEIEAVTANGEVLVANEAQNQDLFWALRGGGGGTFAVVTAMTLRTHQMPETVGLVSGTISAEGDAAYRRLVREFISFYPDNLDNEHWGEQVRLAGDNSMRLSMTFLDLQEGDAHAVWRPFTDWIAKRRDVFSADIRFRTVPFVAFWDVRWWEEHAPEFIARDVRMGQPPNQFWWAGDQGQVSQYLNTYKSRWLPISLFEESAADELVDALVEASRFWPCVLHTNKGLSGASSEAIARDRTTSVNPSVFDATALIIMSSHQYAYPGVPGHEPDRATGRAEVRRVDLAMKPIRDVTPGAGTYSNEADFFEPDWQHSFWGDNYSGLLDIKRKYDPTNIFRVHHGVGSDT